MPDASKVRTIRSVHDLKVIEESIRSAAASTIGSLRDIFERTTPVEAMSAMKFEPIGFDPLAGHALNVVEQINQMFTYLASCAAVRYLIEKHPESAPFTMNLGTSAGSDIHSVDGLVAAEVFAATRPNSNDKLRRDVAKVGATAATHRYVFYSCRSDERGERSRLATTPDVCIVSLGCLPAADGGDANCGGPHAPSAGVVPRSVERLTVVLDPIDDRVGLEKEDHREEASCQKVEIIGRGMPGFRAAANRAHRVGHCSSQGWASRTRRVVGHAGS